MKQITICLIPKVSGVGGMVSFRQKMAAGLTQRGIAVCKDPGDPSTNALLVIGGTRQLGRLWRARRRGVRIVQRLNGMNWLHRVRKTGVRHYLRAEYGNMILGIIRDQLADRVIYQSEFARRWWESASGETKVPSAVVYNGVDLELFRPDRDQGPVEDRVRVLLVEGSIMGGYELGLEHALELGLELGQRPKVAHSHYGAMKVELVVVGQVKEQTRAHINRLLAQSDANQQVAISWQRLVSREQIPAIDRSAHLLYSADINAACPNSVIEALACGTPVISFDTGALPELLAGGAGKVVPYGNDPWKLGQPDIPSLSKAAVEVLDHRERYSQSARERALDLFGLDKMVDGYLEVMLG